MRSLIVVLLVVTPLIVTATDLHVVGDTTWYWHMRDDPDTVKRSLAELDSLIKLHEMWVADSLQGERLSLYGATVRRANISNTDLQSVDLSRADLTGTFFSNVNLSRANLFGAILVEAAFSETDLRNASFFMTDLRDANLSVLVLKPSGELIPGTETDLSGACFDYIEFLPDVDAVASAKGLRDLTYSESPAFLIRLRKAFADSGYARQERQIICALRRHDQAWYERVLFDWTSEYGSNLTTTLKVLGLIWFACGAIYWGFMMWSRESGVRVIGRSMGDGDMRDANIARLPSAHLCRRNFGSVRVLPDKRLRLPDCLRLIWWAWFFSAISAFNIGFRDVNFGRWLKMLTRRKFDLEPFGWVRVISGFQALISVYLIALLILSFAGTPFAP